MTDRKTAAFPQSIPDKMPYPPTPAGDQIADLGADAEAAIQSAQTFTPVHEESYQSRLPSDRQPKTGRWHTALLLIAAAAVGAAFLIAIR